MAQDIAHTIAIYARAVIERDAAVRDQLLAQCWAEQGRLITQQREFVGRAAVSQMVGQFLAREDVVGVRMLSPLDVHATIFRYLACVDLRDGRSPESFDAGVVDDQGRIALMLTFVGSLPPR